MYRCIKEMWIDESDTQEGIFVEEGSLWTLDNNSILKDTYILSNEEYWIGINGNDFKIHFEEVI